MCAKNNKNIGINNNNNNNNNNDNNDNNNNNNNNNLGDSKVINFVSS